MPNPSNDEYKDDELTDEELMAKAIYLEQYRKALEEQLANEYPKDQESQVASSRVPLSQKENAAPSVYSKKPRSKAPAPLPPRAKPSIIQDLNHMENSGYAKQAPTADNLARLYF